MVVVVMLLIISSAGSGVHIYGVQAHRGPWRWKAGNAVQSQNWSKLRNLCGLQTPPTMIRYLDYTNLYVDSYLS